jgi:hypothetical protein
VHLQRVGERLRALHQYKRSRHPGRGRFGETLLPDTRPRRQARIQSLGFNGFHVGVLNLV